MQNIYHHFKTWEDWQNGMYSTSKPKPIKINKSANLLKTPLQLYKAMRHVAFNWKYSAEQNLTNNSRNRQAWLGQASCCYICSASDFETKCAWHTLNSNEQFRANAIADVVLEEWEKFYAQN